MTRTIDFLRHKGIPIIGLVSMMDGYLCPSCGLVTRASAIRRGNRLPSMRRSLCDHLDSEEFLEILLGIERLFDIVENFWESAAISSAHIFHPFSGFHW